jgi:HD-GYP domain-containing protein (c-di-GMP phosphodiesterase class II)
VCRWMPGEGPHRGERIRAAEVAAALSLATDLGMGFPFEHGLHSTLTALRLGQRLGVDRETASQTYYACLLTYSGCTADAEITAQVFGGSMATHFAPVTFGSERDRLSGIVRALPTPESRAPVRAIQIARRLPKAAKERDPHLAAICEVAQMLSERLGLPKPVGDLFVHLTERWDGKGYLRRAKGEEIPLPLRITQVARDATLHRMLGGDEHAVRIVRERAGHAFDPQVANCLADGAEEILAHHEAPAWDETLTREPQPALMLEGEAIDRALAAIGDFADLTSPYLAGHSGGVAGLANAAAHRCRIDAAGAATIGRAALVHDLGRVAVPPRIWQKPGPLTPDEWEKVRLHPYHTERVLSRSSFLSALAPVASAHHERLDGSGYHRGSAGAELAFPSRLLAAADVYHAMTEPRPHRGPLLPEQAAEELGREASVGRLDADAVAAVVEAAGQRVPRLERPAGLTEREVEVVAMLARGRQTKQVARALGISVKTADRHIQNAYRKIGVSTRAGATLFAMEHGLAAWGELPIAAPAARS